MALSGLSRAAAAALLLLAAGQAEAGGLTRFMQGRDAPVQPKRDLHPPLKGHPETREPQEHDDYHKHDYPHDEQPKNLKGLKFDHPYPAVQDSDEYDQDFPKDENGDDGEWQAQIDYDTARTWLRKRRDAAAKARKMVEHHEQELKEISRQMDMQEELERDAEQRVQDARQALDEAREELLHAGFSEDGNSTEFDDELREAIDAVAKATEHVDDCEEALEKAKDALEKRLEELHDAEKENVFKVLERSEQALATHGKLNRTATASSMADFKLQRARDRVAAAERELAEAEERLAKAHQERVEQEERMQKAEAELRVFRRKVGQRVSHPDYQAKMTDQPASAVETEGNESGAPRAASAALTLALAALATVAAMAA